MAVEKRANPAAPNMAAFKPAETSTRSVKTKHGAKIMFLSYGDVNAK